MTCAPHNSVARAPDRWCDLSWHIGHTAGAFLYAAGAAGPLIGGRGSGAPEARSPAICADPPGDLLSVL